MKLPFTLPTLMNLRRYGAVAALLLAVVGTGCRSLPLQKPWDVAGAGWTLREGQAIWRPGGDATEIAGDLSVATHADGRSVVQFTKPPFPFVVAQEGPAGWQVQFFAQEKNYAGRGKPPQRILWLHLADGLAGRLDSATWRFEEPGSGQFRLVNKTTGEALEGFLQNIAAAP